MELDVAAPLNNHDLAAIQQNGVPLAEREGPFWQRVGQTTRKALVIALLARGEELLAHPDSMPAHDAETNRRRGSRFKDHYGLDLPRHGDDGVQAPFGWNRPSSAEQERGLALLDD